MLSTPARTARFLKHLVRSTNSRHLVRKPVIWLIVFFYVCMAVFIIAVTPARIAQFTYDVAQGLRYLSYGYMLLIVAMVVISFPPFIGYGTLLNLFGFTYGMKGFIPAAVGTLAGSAIVFVILRMTFGRRLRSWTPTNAKWQALEAVIRSRGLPLIILIRMSPPVPWAWSNSLFASIESVSLLQFFIATWFVLPKVFVYVFVGYRVARLSDGKQRIRMTTQAKIFNAFIIACGFLSTILASSVVYYFMQKEIKHLQASSSKRDEVAADVLGAKEETPYSNSTVRLSIP
ncbi:Golgi apparatus membrane protein TVP38 [Suillus weaverae]|nr:Golgi apparatus membrane protein TVP38 [Suillus weaverae]